jgi:hypothetical protein
LRNFSNSGTATTRNSRVRNTTHNSEAKLLTRGTLHRAIDARHVLGRAAVLALVGAAEVHHVQVGLVDGLHRAHVRVGAVRHGAEDAGYLDAVTGAHL